MRIVGWIKNHKLSFLLLIILIYILFKDRIIPYSSQKSYLNQPMSIGGNVMMEKSYDASSARIGILPPQQDIAPAPEVTDRLVIQESSLSLLVKNVRENVNKIINYANSNGGYMVNSSLSSVQEVPSASVTIRVPAKNIETALEYLRGLSVKVVSENLTGRDVTDQYVDIDARLTTLNKTKTKFEDILDKAVKVEDILNVQREIINLQSQIDSLKGQQQYLSKSAQMAKITVYLSTDELALPYAPSEAWRPSVIFKTAVRSLIGFGRSLGTAAIWIGVYSVIWIPALVIFYFLRKRFFH